MTNRPLGLTMLLLVLGATLTAGPALAFQGILADPAAFQISGAWTGGAITWDIVQDTTGFYYYNYRLLAPDGEPPVDTFLIEIDPSLTAGDFFGTTGHVVVGDFTVADNPNIPRDIHAIGFLNINQNRVSFDFKTYKSPVWGDFYVKSGEPVPSTAFNVGFTNPGSDPTSPPADGSLSFHILTVGPTAAPIPDASTLLLACSGIVGLLAARRRFSASR